MKLPFVSRKKYDNMKENYRIAMKSKEKINTEFLKWQREASEKDKKRELSFAQIQDNCRILVNNSEIDAYEIVKLKKEIKRLKFLCSKNGIKYDKKEEKNEKKNSH